MNSKFDGSLDILFMQEGIDSDDKTDRGGRTRFGVSLRFIKGLPNLEGDYNGDGHVTAADIAGLSIDDAREIYREHFWDHYKLEAIDSYHVASKAFGYFVNMRGHTAGRILQRSCNRLGSDLIVDGLAGSKTMAAINSLEPFHLIDCIKVESWAVYVAIMEHDKSQRKYYNGWQNRAFSNV